MNLDVSAWIFMGGILLASVFSLISSVIKERTLVYKEKVHLLEIELNEKDRQIEYLHVGWTLTFNGLLHLIGVKDDDSSGRFVIVPNPGSTPISSSELVSKISETEKMLNEFKNLSKKTYQQTLISAD